MTALSQQELHELANTQDGIARLVDYLDELRQLLEAQQRPAVPRTFALTAQAAVQRDEVRDRSMSIAVLNPNPLTVFIGFGGGKATKDARAWSIPAGSAIVIPVSFEDLEIGVDPTDPNLATGDAAVVQVLRFETVQPFFFGAL